MFKKHALQVKLVRSPKNVTETSTPTPPLSSSEIKMIKDVATKAAVFVLASAVVLKFTDAACEIAINYAPKK